VVVIIMSITPRFRKCNRWWQASQKWGLSDYGRVGNRFLVANPFQVWMVGKQKDVYPPYRA